VVDVAAVALLHHALVLAMEAQPRGFDAIKAVNVAEDLGRVLVRVHAPVRTHRRVRAPVRVRVLCHGLLPVGDVVIIVRDPLRIRPE